MVLGDTKDDQSYNPSIMHLLQAVRLSKNALVAAQFFGDSNPMGFFISYILMQNVLFLITLSGITKSLQDGEPVGT